MNTKVKTAALALAASMFVAGPVLAPFASNAEARPLIVQALRPIDFNAGDVIPVTLNEKLSSAHSNPGDTFTTTVDASQPGYRRLDGDIITGHVTDVERSRHHHPGRLSVQFDKLTTRDGKTFDIDGSPIGLDDNALHTNSDGTFVANKTTGHDTAAWTGIGAGTGAVLGLITTGGLSLGATLLGGAVGAVGSVISGHPKGHDVYLDPGTKMGVQLNSGFDYPNY